MQHTLSFHKNGSANGTSDVKNGHKSSRQSGLMHFSENEEEEESDEEAEEEETDEDEEEEDVDDEDLEDEEEELEDDENSYEEEDEDEEYTRGINLGIQTSPGLDDTVDSGNLNGGGPRFRNSLRSGPSRFISSTPAPPVKSTSAYFSNSPLGANENQVGNGKAKQAFPANSPLRRHVAGNTKAFGSLGEVLASLPMAGQKTNTGLSHRSTWSSNPTSQGFSNSQTHSFPSTTTSNSHLPNLGGAPVSAADLTTQVQRRSNHNAIPPQNTDLNRRSTTFCTSQNVSKLIIVMAGIFFLVLSYKYATLRPSIDVERLVCLEGQSKDHPTCVPKELEDAVTNITRDFVNVLERKSVEMLCEGNESNLENVRMSVSEILKVFIKERETLSSEKLDDDISIYDNEYDLKSNGFENDLETDKTNDEDEDDVDDPSINTHKTKNENMPSENYENLFDKSFKENVQLVLSLISENPQWGIKIICNETETGFKADPNDMEEEERTNIDQIYQKQFPFEKTYLQVASPPISWECWLRIGATSMYSLIFYCAIKLTYLAIIVLFGYGIYRIYSWRQEKLIREQQDVFELVEQVLSMLVAQHQQYHAIAAAATVNVSPSNGPPSFNSKPCVAVNHIRDQLIPPTVSI